MDQKMREMFVEKLKRNSRYEISVTRNNLLSRRIAGSLVIGEAPGPGLDVCESELDWHREMISWQGKATWAEVQVNTLWVRESGDTAVWLEQTVCVGSDRQLGLKDLQYSLFRGWKFGLSSEDSE